MLSPSEQQRYEQHLLLQGFGAEAQSKLREAAVFVVGAGGLGSPVLLYLAAVGVGRIGVVDGDRVELRNLHRQVLHGMPDIGRLKVDSAREKLAAIDPECEVTIFAERLTPANIGAMTRGYELLVDCSDNFPTRFTVCDHGWLAKVPVVSAAALRFGGLLLTILPTLGMPCYRCFVPEPPPAGLIPTCREVGVLGPAVGVMGTLQAVETLKVLAGMESILSRDLLRYDARDGTFKVSRRLPDPACPLCGPQPSITRLAGLPA